MSQELSLRTPDPIPNLREGGLQHNCIAHVCLFAFCYYFAQTTAGVGINHLLAQPPSRPSPLSSFDHIQKEIQKWKAWKILSHAQWCDVIIDTWEGPRAVPDEESQVPFLVLFFPRTSYLIVYRPFRQEGGKDSKGFTQTPFWPPKDFIYRLTILIALLFVSGSLASLPLRINTVQMFKEDQRMNPKSCTSGLCCYACKFVRK